MSHIGLQDAGDTPYCDMDDSMVSIIDSATPGLQHML